MAVAPSPSEDPSTFIHAVIMACKGQLRDPPDDKVCLFVQKISRTEVYGVRTLLHVFMIPSL